MWISFFWHSTKYECNGSRAKLSWYPLGISYLARDPLPSYFDECQKNKITIRNISSVSYTTNCTMVRIPTGSGKHRKWLKKCPCMEKSWNLKINEKSWKNRGILAWDCFLGKMILNCSVQKWKTDFLKLLSERKEQKKLGWYWHHEII